MSDAIYKFWLGCPKIGLLQNRQGHSQGDNFWGFQKCLQIVQGQLLGLLQGKVC